MTATLWEKSGRGVIVSKGYKIGRRSAFEGIPKALPVVEDRRLVSLLKAGRAKASARKGPVILRLAGRPGRAQERAIFPPTVSNQPRSAKLPDPGSCSWASLHREVDRLRRRNELNQQENTVLKAAIRDIEARINEQEAKYSKDYAKLINLYQILSSQIKALNGSSQPARAAIESSAVAEQKWTRDNGYV